MYKILKADKDAYLTNRFIRINGVLSSRTGSNVGSAGSLDLFKLYGTTFSGTVPNLELSRLLIHFDLDELKDQYTSGLININHSTFNCTLKLFDVYGGQTTPSNFNISIYPLSKSFDEGGGRDVVYYSDFDACNYISASINDLWISEGAGFGGGSNQICDYITGSTSIDDFKKTQTFITGEENLNVDVTKIISATLVGLIPDSGFRISLSSEQEDNQYSYYVKRFASRSAYDETKHPKLVVKYNDSIQDDSKNLRFDQLSSIFLRNYAYGELSNITSGSSSTQITGSNSLLLKLSTPISGGNYELIFTGSQHSNGSSFYSGIYSASFTVALNQNLNKKLQQSGSVIFTPIWHSIDGSVTYLTGSDITFYGPQRGSSNIDFKNYVVNVSGIQSLHRTNESIFVRVNVFDYTSPTIKLTKRPIELPGLVLRKCYYQVRDVLTNDIIIEFDEKYDSTRISSDADGMYFILDTTNLVKERSYIIDILLIIGSTKKVFKSVSNMFNISDTQVI